jgi:hypothetical protein
MRVPCVIYTGYYNVSNMSYMISPPQPFSLFPSPPIPGVVSTGIIIVFIYMCTHFFAPYSPSYPIFLSLSPPTGANPAPGQHMFHFPVLWFCRRKKREDKMKNMTFLLV